MSACAWCGKPAVDTAEIEPAVYGSKRVTVTENGRTFVKSAKVTKRRATTAEVCARHLDMVEQGRRDREARQLERRMRRERARRGTGAIR